MSELIVDSGNCICQSSVRDYIALMKPRVMSLVVFTALIAMLITPSSIHPLIGFISILCIALGAGSAAAINMWYDRDIDALMLRTKLRPIVTGRIAPDEALAFGLICGFFSLMLMALCVNFLSAFLLLFAIIYYAIIYTVWLKRRSISNVVIGGVSGAMPPVIGWVAATNSLDIQSLSTFFSYIFMDPPHSWALVLYRLDDYKISQVPMLPAIRSALMTKLQILLYTLLTCIVSILPFVLNMSGIGYLLIVSGLDLVFLYYVFLLFQKTNLSYNAKKLFIYSIFYLFMLFCCLLIFNN